MKIHKIAIYTGVNSYSLNAVDWRTYDECWQIDFRDNYISFVHLTTKERHRYPYTSIKECNTTNE